MAVFQDAPVRGSSLPAAGTPARAARATAASGPHAGARVRPAGLLMAGIIGATVLGMVYLTQTLGSVATTSEIRYTLEAERKELVRQIRTHELEALEVIQAEAVVPRARKQDLQRLGDPIVLRAP